MYVCMCVCVCVCVCIGVLFICTRPLYIYMYVFFRYRLVTGSEDHTARIWDLRQNKTVYTLPAHTSLVSMVKYEPENGRFLVTGSYDRSIKAWASPTWAPLRTLTGHDGKIMALDVARGMKGCIWSGVLLSAHQRMLFFSSF